MPFAFTWLFDFTCVWCENHDLKNSFFEGGGGVSGNFFNIVVGKCSGAPKLHFPGRTRPGSRKFGFYDKSCRPKIFFFEKNSKLVQIAQNPLTDAKEYPPPLITT